MKYINHITLNTGHARKTYPHEIDKGVYFVLNRIYKESFKPEGVEIYTDYKLKCSGQGGTVIGTVFANDGMPILTTTCSKDDDGSIWRTLHESSIVPLMTNPEDKPPIPYIADRIEPGAAIHFDAMEWTGDFAKCFGWIALDPKQIR